MSNAQLTGGTGDVNPQVLTIQLVQSGANVDTIRAVPIPVPRLNSQANKSLVFELLQVVCVIHRLPNVDALNQNQQAIATIGLGTVAAGTGFPQTIFQSRFNSEGNGVPLTSAVWFNMKDKTSFRDGSGRGILIASDNLVFRLRGINMLFPNIADFRLLYRFKQVALQEYLGIVASQLQ